MNRFLQLSWRRRAFAPHRLRSLAIVSALVLVCGCFRSLMVPSDPQAACTVAAPEIAGWFESGSATLNGVVKPADSLMFSDSPNCDFYKWSEQMFLWLT